MPKEIINNFSRQESRYLELALNLAKSSAVPRYKHGSVIVKGGRVVSTGINKIRNHPDVLIDGNNFSKNDAHVHAEVDAIKKVSSLKGAKIYVARITKGGSAALSRPCEECYDAIVSSGITKIVYT